MAFHKTHMANRVRVNNIPARSVQHTKMMKKVMEKMARLPSSYSSAYSQHGNNRNVFLLNSDNAVYLSKLEEYGQKYNMEVDSYILTTNHVHLLLTLEKDDGINRLIRSSIDSLAKVRLQV